jgi:hypothetical protein
MVGVEFDGTVPAAAAPARSASRLAAMPWLVLTAALGLFSFTVVLSAYHIADGDLWAKLAIGAFVWIRGAVPHHDLFAFTPTLPKYIDHEWGAGALFYGLLHGCGPSALMALKIVLFVGAISFAALAARRNSVNPITTLLLALPAAWTVLPAYVPTLRAHTLTFFFFSALLLGLEQLRGGNRKAAVLVVVLMWIWTNMHGGVAAGFGTIVVYAAQAMLMRRGRMLIAGVAIGSLALSLLNPYGIDYWRYLVSAILHPRPRIAEWQPLPLWELDFYLGFRLLCLIVTVSLILGWHRVPSKSWSGLAMLIITAFLGWRSQRHAPFFSIAALAFAGPFLQAACGRCLDSFPRRFHTKLHPAALIALVYAAIAVFVAWRFVPTASWEILAPIGHDPVREADILSRAQLRGNLAVPFGWGSYASWRLYPNIKVSHDGRYEAAYPESTFELNNDFFERHGANWDRLIRQWPVDFVILDLQHERLRPEDLLARGYDLIWQEPDTSALLALSKHASTLRKVAAELPPTTTDPLDPKIPRRWFRH